MDSCPSESIANEWRAKSSNEDLKQLEVVEQLEEWLTTTPLLAPPKWDGKAIINTDDSNKQVGSVSRQMQSSRTLRPNGRWSRISYYAETRYDATHR